MYFPRADSAIKLRSRELRLFSAAAAIMPLSFANFYDFRALSYKQSAPARFIIFSR